MQDILFKEVNTVKNQRRSILQKLNIFSMEETIGFIKKLPRLLLKTSRIIIKKPFKNSLKLHKSWGDVECTAGQHVQKKHQNWCQY